MTEKRFVFYEHKGADYILDTPNMSLDFIEMLGDCLEAEEIVDLLNNLYEENVQLKQENDWLHEAVNEATNFIYDNFEVNRMFTDRELNDICNDMGWELSEKGIKLQQLEKENEQLKKVFSDVAKDHEVIVEDLIMWSGGLITELEKENEQLKQTSQDYEDIVNNWFIDNWDKLSDEMKQSAHLEVGIDIEYDGDVE